MCPDNRHVAASTQGSGEPQLTPVVLAEREALPLLRSAQVIGGQRMHYGSNYTFFVGLDAGNGRYLRAVYKPQAGERPLHDFPRGTLYKREYATFLVSRELGWPDVPLTLVREGPHGVGAFQLFIEADPQMTYFELAERHADTFRKFAVFDVLVNNADRKGGHCLLGKDGRIWSIDHGLTFHEQFKVRSVMLEFWGAEIPQPLLDDLARLKPCLQGGGKLAALLGELLTGDEVEALVGRLDYLLESKTHPVLDPASDVPWPLV
ncbi:MAG: SCO1664 family protein [SAR202 cluster bacterium]|nr:SCO1664 family protein [SAR202 cluster bacterium]